MVAIATPTDLAASLQSDVDTATATLLLELAQGMITEQIGEHDPWPAIAKATALAATGRAYRNPQAAKRATAGPFAVEPMADEFGVYLTEAERSRLQEWLTRGRGAVGTIRTTSGYPPIAEECPTPTWYPV
jgi:hypothetical protein